MPNNAKDTRKCIVCREHAHKSALIRIVVSPEGLPVIDNNKNISGRGIYVHKDAQCINTLKRKKLLSSTLKIQVADEFYEEL